jgi:hypothetical protein
MDNVLSEEFLPMLTSVRSMVFVTLFLSWARISAAQDANSSVASQAVVHFSFGEESGSARDLAKVGKASDEGKLINDPVRIPSPFWNQSGKKALQLDAAKQQCLEIANGPDVAAPQGITIGLFCVNLTESTDAEFHGLFAKRGTTDGKLNANYGINFSPQSDNFQVYIHDGGEYRVATYSSKDAFPFRKRIYVTVTFTAGDAPASQDADTDADDVRMQYFINGEPLNPKASTRGFVNGSEAWTLDVNLPGLLNDAPLDVGRTMSNIEYTSCIIGDFRVFPRALSPDEVKRLFLEVVSNVDELIAADKPVPTVVPVIGNLSQPGLQAGQTTQLVVDGSDLGPDSVAVFPLPEVQFAIADGSTANRLVMNVTVPPEAVPGIYPIWIKSKVGISRSKALAIDRLPQVPMGSSPEKPASLPAAFFGNLSGGQQQLVYIAGKKGQRVVVDAEMKRLGSAANPVIEIKSTSGNPLAIGWGQNSLRGDARTELFLPSDGIYTIELHDLTFNAPGVNPFRLKIGDLKLVDGVIPAAALPGAVEVEPVGSGFTAGTKLAGQFASPGDSSSGSIALATDAGFAGGVPPVSLSRGVEIVEAPRSAGGKPQIIQVAFNPSLKTPVAISGRISTKGEKDTYLLSVTEGHKLRFTLQSDSLNSALEGEIQIFGSPQGNVLAMSSDQPTVGDPSLEFTVPGSVSQILVQVRDLFGRGDARSFYRLVIEPADLPRFSLMLNSPTVNLPEDGSAIIEVQVTRAGYNGPIQLSVAGDNAVTVSPGEIAANIQGKMWLRLVRRGKAEGSSAAMLRLVGQTVGVEPVIRRTARLQTGAVAPTFTDTLGIGTTAPAGLSIELPQQPTVLFRSVTTELGVSVNRRADHASASLPVRLVLDSTEPVRRRDPNNPAAGTFPVITASPRMILPNEPDQASIKLTIPLDVVEPTIDLAIKAESLSHAFSERVLFKAFSQPIHAEIKNAVTPKVDEATLAVVGEVDHKVTGAVQRTPGFAGPIEVALVGLPAGYSAPAVNLAPDQDKFELIVRAPKVAAETPVPNVKLRVTTGGSLLVPEISVNLKVVPGT